MGGTKRFREATWIQEPNNTHLPTPLIYLKIIWLFKQSKNTQVATIDKIFYPKLFGSFKKSEIK